MDDKRIYQHEDIEEIVKEYQQGNELAGEELLRIFGCHPQEAISKYVGKYYDLLRYGKIDFKNRDLRRFVSLFISDPVLRKNLIPFYQYKETKVATIQIVEWLRQRFEKIEEEDFVQDLRLLLLQQARRYVNKGKVNFCGYLYNSYRFAIYHYYQFLFQDMLYQQIECNQQEVENESDRSSMISIEESWFFEDMYFDYESEELGFNWIHNQTTTFPFNQLNPYERTILFLYYEKGYTDKMIAGITGYHEDTVWNHRKKTKEKLRMLLQDGEDHE